MKKDINSRPSLNALMGMVVATEFLFRSFFYEIMAWLENDPETTRLKMRSYLNQKYSKRIGLPIETYSSPLGLIRAVYVSRTG